MSTYTEENPSDTKSKTIVRQAMSTYAESNVIDCQAIDVCTESKASDRKSNAVINKQVSTVKEIAFEPDFNILVMLNGLLCHPGVMQNKADNIMTTIFSSENILDEVIPECS